MNLRAAIVLTFAAALSFGCAAPRDLLRDPATRPSPDTLHAVVEIPCGTTEKWEVGLDGRMRIDRVVAYLGYPANYGIVPRAILGEELGGDGDPLDVLVLGPALPRGSVAAVRAIGTIRLVDGGERDDKVLAVPLSGPLSAVHSVAQLDAQFPGVTAILRLWFENYKGPGRLTCGGFGEAGEAAALVERCAASFARNAR